MKKTLGRLGLLILFYLPLSTAAADGAELWAKLLDGDSVAIMRHAIAPGNGDPVNFIIGVCTTQRNLSDEGRAQATAIGALFREQGILQADVFSSEWCRCMETAVLLGLTQPNALPIMNSFYQDRSSADQQIGELRQWVKTRLEKNQTATTLPAVLVTHQVNITGLTSVYPASGEIVFVGLQDNEVVVLGRLAR